MEEKKEETLEERKARLYKDAIENGEGQKKFDKQVAEFKQRNHQRELSGENVIVEKEKEKEEEIKYTVEDLAAMNTQMYKRLQHIDNYLFDTNQTLRRLEKIVKSTYRMNIETMDAFKDIWHLLIINQQAPIYDTDFDEFTSFKKIIDENKELKAELEKEIDEE